MENQSQLESLLLNRQIRKVKVEKTGSVELILDNNEIIFIECGIRGVTEYDSQPVVIRSLGKVKPPKLDINTRVRVTGLKGADVIGIISERGRNNVFCVTYHNGMKLTTQWFCRQNIMAISDATFNNYIKRTGHTALACFSA